MIKAMRYAFVFLSIFTIWVAVVIIATVVPGFNPEVAQRVALLMTAVLFVIGFRRV